MTLFGVGANSSPGSGGNGAAAPRSLFGFDVIDRIGEGAGSTIYAVSDPKNNHLYALKHVVNNGDKTARFVEQLEAEHAVGQLVRHPGLRRTYDLKINKNLL